MPLFNTAFPNATALSVGDTFNLFSADTVASNSLSPVIAVGPSGPIAENIKTWQVNWASAPTANVLIYGSNVPPTTAGPQNGQLLYTMTTQSASQSDNSAFAFYWAQVTAYSAGGALTVSVHVG
jgi:hypothetical protein